MTVNQDIKVYSIPELSKMVNDGFIELRTVNQAQVRSLKKYIIEESERQQVYLPMIVAHEESNGKITVIDGAKRVRALHQLFQENQQAIQKELDGFLTKRMKLAFHLEQSKIAVQIFKGLTKEEQHQLYIDFNTKGKKVSLSKLIEYDSRNVVNQITNAIIANNPFLKEAGIETEKRAMIRPANQKFLSLSQLRQIVGIFLTGKFHNRMNEITVPPVLSQGEYVDLINFWFQRLFECHPHKTIGNYEKTILANFLMIQSIAIFVNEGMANEKYNVRKQMIERRMNTIKHIDWSVKNKQWEKFNGSYRGSSPALYFFQNDKTTLTQIVQWLHGHALKEVM
jgi:DNA sulfur modification protein DndB